MNSDEPYSRDPVRAPDAQPGTTRSVQLVDNRVDSVDLFATTREITIEHGAEVYRLRLTAQNKLILTK
ncbi:MAG: hemin uptake protein HemP [Hyphomicrobiales bacterium]|nr:hemin uptake protein HemP [Hyphomicrobiales bacterium]